MSHLPSTYFSQCGFQYFNGHFGVSLALGTSWDTGGMVNAECIQLLSKGSGELSSKVSGQVAHSVAYYPYK